VAPLGIEDGKMILTTEKLNAIIYAAIRDLNELTNPVTPIEAFDDLPEALQTIFNSQMAIIIDDIKTRPKELHDKWKVTAQELIDSDTISQDLVANLETYMLPFRKLPVWKQTEYRLQLQLARTLLRHNRNVERYEKRQR